MFRRMRKLKRKQAQREDLIAAPRKKEPATKKSIQTPLNDDTTLMRANESEPWGGCSQHKRGNGQLKRPRA